MSILSPEILKEIQDQQQGIGGGVPSGAAGNGNGGGGLKQHQPLSLSTSTSGSSPLASPTNPGGMSSYSSNIKSGQPK